jgi:hypothetical protein
MIEAAGWIGMPESEFWETTPRYFAARVRGKQRDDREKWVMARQAAYWTILPHMGKKQIKPTALGVFEWEQQPLSMSKEITPEQKADMSKFKEMALKLLN